MLDGVKLGTDNSNKKTGQQTRGKHKRVKEDEKDAEKEEELITPNKEPMPKNYYAGIEALRGRKRKTASTFKRRKALGKDGWGKTKQSKMDKFLVPRKRKAKQSEIMIMGATDSFS